MLRNAGMPSVSVTHRRAELFRQHARELIASAWRTDNISDKRHLFELAKQYQRAADELMPLPPGEPGIFPALPSQHSAPDKAGHGRR
jgi:hypothetical protein